MSERTRHPGQTPSGAAGASGVSLPVLGNGSPDGRRPRTIRHSKSGRRRAAALIALNVLMIAHIVQWKIQGRTISPIEPSESMYTIENGLVNAGFIFFAAALLATLIFGRFVCGWACHIVALQDLCGWGMKKIGVRPKPFRSRLLIYAPLILALYMFVWPTFKRLAVAPLLQRWWPDGLAWMGGVREFPGFSNHLITEDFWATFPTVWVAVPFLLVCGFAVVYFLGAKGYCTYGCPYGGFFAPLDKVSFGRIKADLNKCEGCGHCTAVCTSNVRVHEEIQLHEMVVDPGCMKCLDCVSVCPNDALSFGFARPAALKGRPDAAESQKRRPAPDLSWGEEWMLAGVFLFTVLGVRGVYEVVPLLFAMGIAGCATFIFWKMWRMRRDDNVRIIGLQLRRKGAVTPGGWAFAAGGLLLAAFVVQSFAVNAFRWRGDYLDALVHVPREVVFQGRTSEVPEEQRELAGHALEMYTKSLSWRRGGVGLADASAPLLRSSWLHLVRGETEQAEAALSAVIERSGERDGLCADLGRIMLLEGRADEAIAYYERVYADNKEFEQVRDTLCALYADRGRAADAATVYRNALEDNPRDGLLRAKYANLQAQTGDVAGALENLEQAVVDAPRHASVRNSYAIALMFAGRVEDAAGEMTIAAELDPAQAGAYHTRAAGMLLQNSRPELALDHLRKAVEADPENPGARFDLSVVLVQRGDLNGALEQLEHVARLDPANAQRIFAHGAGMLEAAGRSEDAARWRARAEQAASAPGARDDQ